MAKKMVEQGTIADIPIRPTTKVYFIRVEDGNPTDEGWVTVDEARRMNASDKRMHGRLINRYFKDKDVAGSFQQSLRTPGGKEAEPPPDQAPEGQPEPPPDLVTPENPPEQPPVDLGDVGPVPDTGGGIEQPGPEADMGIQEPGPEDTGLPGEDGMDLSGEGDMGLPGEGGMGLGPEDDMGLGPEEEVPEEQELELVVPRRVRLVPSTESKEYWKSIRLLEEEKTEDPGWDFEKLAALAKERNMKPLEVEKLTSLYEDDPESFEVGKKIESEHSSCPVCQRIIACHHLQEFTRYYQELPEMEDELKSGSDEDSKEEALETTESGLVEAMLNGDASAEEAITLQEESTMDEKCGGPGERAKKLAGKSYSKKRQPHKFWGTAQEIQKNISAKGEAVGPGTTIAGVIEAIMAGDVTAQELVEVMDEEKLAEDPAADAAIRDYIRLVRAGKMPIGKKDAGAKEPEKSKKAAPPVSAPKPAQKAPPAPAEQQQAPDSSAARTFMDLVTAESLKKPTTKTESLDEFSMPERQEINLWARGNEVKRRDPKNPFHFEEDAMFSKATKVAVRNLKEKTAKVLSPRLLDAYCGRHSVLAQHGLKSAGYAVRVVDKL